MNSRPHPKLHELTEEELEEFEERASIMEYMNGNSRKKAEYMALKRLLEKRGEMDRFRNVMPPR